MVRMNGTGEHFHEPESQFPRIDHDTQKVSIYPCALYHLSRMQQLLMDYKMTNGGGKSEAVRCEELSKRLETKVLELNRCLSTRD